MGDEDTQTSSRVQIAVAAGLHPIFSAANGDETFICYIRIVLAFEAPFPIIKRTTGAVGMDKRRKLAITEMQCHFLIS
jgi:hypothetical protein